MKSKIARISNILFHFTVFSALVGGPIPLPPYTSPINPIDPHHSYTPTTPYIPSTLYPTLPHTQGQAQ